MKMTVLIALLIIVTITHVDSFYINRITLNRTTQLSSTPSGKTPLVANGKRVEVDPGSSLIQACVKLGLKVPTQCRKGDCGTCTVTVAGSKIRACIGKVPPAPRLKSLIEKGLAVSVDNAR